MKPETSPLRTSSLSLHESGRVAIVSAEWHVDIMQRLIQGAKSARLHHAQTWTCEEFTVPGSFEIPQLVSALAKTRVYDAIVPLGCLIRGETAHFELIATTVFQALDGIGRETGVAVSNGVLTVENIAQALERSGGSLGNKGEEAMVAALSLCASLRKIRS